MGISEKKVKGIFWRTDYYGAVCDGGVFSNHYNHMKAFIKLGHKCVFVTGGNINLPEDVKVYFIPHSKLYRNLPEIINLPYNTKASKEMIKIIDKENPDFLYHHISDFNYSGSKVKLKLGIPFFLQLESVQSWVKKNWGKLYLKHFIKWAEHIQLEMADAIFVISENVKKQLAEMGYNSQKIYVQPSAIDPEQFHPGIADNGLREKYKIHDKFVVGFTGSFGLWHGIEYLASSLKELVKRIPNVHLLLVGDGYLRPKVEEILKNDNVEKYATITGYLPFKDMPFHVAACDVLVSPCVNNPDGTPFFNSPVKLFEYMAMGKPIVATRVGQQNDVIIHNHNGLMCDEKNPNELAEMIYRFYEDPALSIRLSKQARVDAVNKHDWRIVVNNFLDVYNKMFGKKS